MVLVFTDYLEDVVRHVCSPREGLPSKQNFLPTIYEVRQACDWWVKLLGKSTESSGSTRILNPGGHVDLEGARRQRLAALQARIANSIPLILPYMPGQPDDPRADPRAGLTFAELRARGYRDEQIQAPRRAETS